MKSIDKHIEELLREYDCVIIPEFGGFITSKKPAFYNEFTSVFYPASKRILFNKHLIYNDGLLANEIAQKQSISFDESLGLLNEFKDECYIRLNEDGRVEIEKVGVLFFDKEKNIQFQQSKVNFLKDSFGLVPLSLEKLPVEEKKTMKPVAAKPVVEKIEQTKVDRVPVSVPKEKKEKSRRKRSAVLLPLIGIPLVLGVLFIGNQQGFVGGKKVNLASLNPFKTVSSEEYIPRNGKTFLVNLKPVVDENDKQEILVPVEKVESEIISEKTPEPKVETILVKENKVISEEHLPEVESTYVEVESSNLELKYHVIAGCFSVKENANNFVESWKDKGNSSSIIDRKGRLYRVAVQSFATRKEAKRFLKETKKSYNNSLWILKK